MVKEKAMTKEEFEQVVYFLLKNGCEIDEDDVLFVDMENKNMIINFESPSQCFNEVVATFSKTYHKCNKNKDYSLRFDASFMVSLDKKKKIIFDDWIVSWIGAYCENIVDADESTFGEKKGDSHICVYKQLSNVEDIKDFFSMYDLVLQIVECGGLYKKPVE